MHVLGGVSDACKQDLADRFNRLQEDICRALKYFEPHASFIAQDWNYECGQGGGRSCVLRGEVLEKAGVNVSCIQGVCGESMKEALELDTDQSHPFWACGISVIVHPMSPHMPAIHFNMRCFVLEDRHWFGGGMDLTPMLKKRRTPEDTDTCYFHDALRTVCQKTYDICAYERFKRQCDAYFYLPHRKEPRGVGGIFYDKINTTWNKDVTFTDALGKAFVNIYTILLERNQSTPWTQQEREEQLQQRTRYVEFNLLYDRGTHFGLKSGGNMDAIFSSMPPLVSW